MIADGIEKVTENGVITIEESKTMKTEIDVVEGMQFDKGYVSSYMCDDKEKMTANMEDPYILNYRQEEWRRSGDRGAWNAA